jgi:hypothetical protein
MSAWIVTPSHVRQLVAGAIRFGVIEAEQAEATGKMLTRANVKSIRARYGEYDEGAARVKPFVWYGPVVTPISDVSLLKQVTEEASASAFDQRVEAIALFRVYREVRGTLIHPRPGQRERAVRIDRLLVPNARLLAMGWEHRTIGVEIKASGVNVGPPFGQAMDYANSVFDLDGLAWVMPSSVFLWPMEGSGGPLASFMGSSRVGSASASRWQKLRLALGQQVLLRHYAYDDTVSLGHVNSGRRTGSR